jgi:hypothetical protein
MPAFLCVAEVQVVSNNFMNETGTVSDAFQGTRLKRRPATVWFRAARKFSAVAPMLEQEYIQQTKGSIIV